MVRMNYFVLLASVIAAFVASSVWYSPLLFGKQFMELSGVGPSAGPSVGKGVGELGRNPILGYVLGRFVVLLEVGGARCDSDRDADLRCWECIAVLRGDGIGSRQVNAAGDGIPRCRLRRHLEMLFRQFKTKERASCQPQP